MSDVAMMTKEEIKKSVNMRLTNRDLQLMVWINQMGFATINQIQAWLGVAQSTAYGRLKKLTQHGFLMHENLLQAKPGFYRVSTMGAEISGSELPPLRHINMGTLVHDVKLVRLSQVLLKRFGGEYISERQLRHHEGKFGFGESSHIPDGELFFENKRVAIELELSKKGKRRLEKIFTQYVKSFNYHEVWYFCGSLAVQQSIEPFAKQHHFIQIFPLDEFLTKHGK